MAEISFHLRRLHGFDYAGSTSGGAIDATSASRPEGRSPGQLERGDPIRFERAFEATTDPSTRLVIVREAAAELARLRVVAKPSAEANGYRTKPPGRPRTTASGTILEKSAEASGLAVEKLRATLANGRKAHPSIEATTLAELDAGSTIAAVARELGVSRRTVERWTCRRK